MTDLPTAHPRGLSILLLGPIIYFTKAVRATGASVVTLWGRTSGIVRNADAMLADPDLYRLCNHLEDLSVVGYLKGAQEITALAREKRVDVIHANSMSHLIKAWIAKRYLAVRYGQKVAIAVSIHNSLPWIPSTQPWQGILRTHLIRSCGDFAIPIAEFMRQRLLSYGFPAERALTVHICIDIEHFDKLRDAKSNEYLRYIPDLRDSPIITYVAALHPWKGHAYYLQAAGTIVSEIPNARFLIIGDGPSRKGLEQMTKALDIDRQVVFTGNMPPASIPQIMAASDICVCASLSEVLPSAILEAMAAGKAVVATTVGGIPELVDPGVTGLLVPPRDADALAKGIIELLRHPERRQAMGLAARQRVEARHSLRVIGQKLIHAYELAYDCTK